MREIFIPLPGGFHATISAWITGVVPCRALASVSAGSWGSVWTPLSGVIVTQVRDCIIFSAGFTLYSLFLSHCIMDVNILSHSGFGLVNGFIDHYTTRNYRQLQYHH
jgi:hypothetical protein